MPAPKLRISTRRQKQSTTAWSGLLLENTLNQEKQWYEKPELALHAIKNLATTTSGADSVKCHTEAEVHTGAWKNLQETRSTDSSPSHSEVYCRSQSSWSLCAPEESHLLLQTQVNIPALSFHFSTSYHYLCWWGATIHFNLTIRSPKSASECKCYFLIVIQHRETFINTWFHPEICLSKWLRIISIANVVPFKAKVISIIKERCFFSPTTWVQLKSAGRTVQKQFTCNIAFHLLMRPLN